MQLFRQLSVVPPDLAPTIVSVGNFDGIHRAHRHMLAEIVRRAREQNSRSVAVTFHPHPARYLRPGSTLKLLTPEPEKLRLFAETGLDAVLLLPFDETMQLTTARDFAQSILRESLHAREVHEGFNFRFGNKGLGDIRSLTEFGREFGFDVFSYPEMRLRGVEVSSSTIRRQLGDGKAHLARHLLGRVFSILSSPAPGRGYGSRYTVPTINLAPYDELIPQNGVYLTRTRVSEECFDSVTNIGNRPTFGADSFAIETHLLNFHPVNLSAETEVEVFFLRRLRAEIKFSSPEALREQIGNDVRKAARYLRLAQRLASPVNM
jgi:riboflavin kinase/FMN adenylyltransferase